MQLKNPLQVISTPYASPPTWYPWQFGSISRSTYGSSRFRRSFFFLDPVLWRQGGQRMPSTLRSGRLAAGRGAGRSHPPRLASLIHRREYLSTGFAKWLEPIRGRELIEVILAQRTEAMQDSGY
jgi:hypothetical protein